MGVANLGNYGFFSAADAGLNAYQDYKTTRQNNAATSAVVGNLLDRATLKDIEADEALRNGELDQAEQVRLGRQAVASRKIGYAASGVKVNEGSSATVLADTAAWSEYERQKVEYRASLESWGLRRDAEQLRREAASIA